MKEGGGILAGLQIDSLILFGLPVNSLDAREGSADLDSATLSKTDGKPWYVQQLHIRWSGNME